MPSFTSDSTSLAVSGLRPALTRVVIQSLSNTGMGIANAEDTSGWVFGVAKEPGTGMSATDPRPTLSPTPAGGAPAPVALVPVPG